MTAAQRVAMVTGGTGALGRAVVRRLLRTNHVLHVPWISEEERSELEGELGSGRSRVTFHQADVTDQEAVTELFGRVRASGHEIHVLANLVGGFGHASLEDTDLRLWQRMFDLNVTSAFLCARAAVGPMKDVGWGRIINVSSGPAVNRGAAGMTAYAAAKAAVTNLTQSLAKELSGSGITVNAVVPSVIDTPANRRAMPAADRSGWLAPEDIAEVITFLAGDSAAIVTGSAVELSRG